MTRDQELRDLELAKLIADKLFRNGFGEEATRLVLIDDRAFKGNDQFGGRHNLGGWSKEPAVDQILKVIQSWRHL